MKRAYVKDIREREWVDAPFLVRDKIMAMAKNGRPYLTIKLMDCTGEVEGRIWDRADEISAGFDRDDFVRVAGKASVYMGKMQLVIQELERIDEAAVDLADFLPVAARPAAELVAELVGLVDGLADADLRRLMRAFLEDDAFMAGFARAPAAKTMHHVYLGGLLEHSLAVAALACDVCGRYPDLNRDLLVVGALLHDVGKVAELSYRRSFEYTDAGKLLGHIVIGVEMVEEKLRTMPGFPTELAVHLKHLLLSHHGQYEYGSPKRPKTMEAVILNHLDDLDSKINGIRTHIGREPDSESSWTQYHRHYDRYFFKGAPSPAECGAAAAPRQQTPSPPQRSEKSAAAGRPKGGAPARPAQPGTRFSNTLAEQLKAKQIDILATERQDKADE